MPDIHVEVSGTWLKGRKLEFLDAINAGLVEALRTPAEETILRLTEHPADKYITPRAAGERFTRIEIAMFVGRSPETKRALYRSLVEHLKPFGVPPEDVKVVLVEVPPDNVGIRGGRAASEVDLGYEVKV